MSKDSSQGKGKKYWFKHNPDNPEPVPGNSLKEDLEEEIAGMDGRVVLTDSQMEKIADMVIAKLGEAVTLYMESQRS